MEHRCVQNMCVTRFTRKPTNAISCSVVGVLLDNDFISVDLLVISLSVLTK